MKNKGFRIFTLLMCALVLLSSCQKVEKEEKKVVERETELQTQAPIETVFEKEYTEPPVQEPEPEVYIEISTKEELSAVRDNLAANYRLVNDIVFEDADFEEGGAFYNNGCGWLPIGTWETMFSGKFDGNGFSVVNLKVNVNVCVTTPTEVVEACGALFYGLSEGVIENLNIVDCDVNVWCESGNNRGASAAAGLVARNIGTVNNCKVSGNVNSYVKGADKKNFGAAGGICGYNSLTVSNCVNEAEVTSKLVLDVDRETAIKSETYNEAYVGFCYVGGIAGSNDSTIENCINYGTVNGESVATNPIGLVYDQISAGGIAGSMGYGDKVYGCTNFGNVNGTTTCGICYVGGIWGGGSVGYIERCGNRGNINGKVTNSRDDKCVYAGGISGGGELVAKDCYNSGTITAKTIPSADNKTEFVGVVCAGGICSGMAGDLINCYNVGKINAERICEYTSLGGIVSQLIPEDSSGLYYLDNISVGASMEDYATKCTDSQMRLAETYVGFDFENVWTIDPASDYPYPTLK